MSNDLELLVGNDQVLTLSGLKNTLTGLYVNGATVTATLRRADGAAVPGGTWPLPMTYAPSSNGNYKAILEDDMQLRVGHTYFLEISVDAGGDIMAFFRDEIVAKFRE